MEFTAIQIAQVINGKVEGDPQSKVHKFAPIEEATAGSLTFLANPAYTSFIYQTQATIALVGDSFVPDQPLPCTIIRVSNPYVALATLLELYKNNAPTKKGISPLAFIATTARIADDVYIGEFAYIGEKAAIGKGAKIYPQCYVGDNTSIGEETVLFSGAKVYNDCVIGQQCTIHSNAVLGADGFGFAPNTDNNYLKVAQIGNVVIEDNVEIGANTTIDRATLGSTIIKRGAKLDNLIQVAHNVVIGENTVVAAQSGFAGSTKVGKNCMIGGQVGISGHLSIGNEVKIAAQTGVTSNIKEGQIIMGSPAMDASKFRKAFIHFRNFESLVKRIDDLEKKLSDLQGQ